MLETRTAVYGSYGVRITEYHSGVKAWELDRYLNRLFNFVADRNFTNAELHDIRQEGLSNANIHLRDHSDIPSSTVIKGTTIWHRLGVVGRKSAQIEYSRKDIITPITLTFEARI